ncbi:MBL fold metallo-hydrolase [Legionella israelensis]|uniref:Outer membrane protein RomA n=1 Tax=Legionella israelensis TaxID=454 RepID=A0A0W0VQJ1_9GAMM|nr:MBL fold metallo-hydrolase [Legionella israelensis]KTD22323.1 outer membrane protein RomA [Legionella israelensis]QBS09816.1 MBL fold metallo-hydrolase [Legionella israelensis]SCY48713.1 L-ascorbate metabolism protein UlaG, beta-lactamase superfamily [Legionella israelensis DSM 19235]STX59368.1 outer membrane protein RomA [Legionella israelensis]
MRYFLLLVFILTGCQGGYYTGPVSDHFDGKKFYYPGEREKPRSFTRDIYNIWTAVFQPLWYLPKDVKPYSICPSQIKGIKISFINHSTVLIQSKKINVLLDPIYSYRASPFSWIGPARAHKPGIHFQNLPKIDVVLISHNHYDHMDVSTLKRLDKALHPLFIVPLGNKIFLKRFAIKNVKELDWWQEIKIKNTRIHFLPAHHSTQRWLHDYNYTLWGSYGLQMGDKKIYYAGDTGYANHFKMIRQHWGRPDFALIPIGAYKPRSLLRVNHIDPFEAVKCHLELGSRLSMGIHWGTFKLSEESVNQPAKDLILAREKLGVSPKAFILPTEIFFKP